MDYPLLDIFWTMLEFFLLVIWFMLLFKIFGDVFRSDDLGGWGKAGWLVFVIVLPFLGVLVYLIARGSSMAQREIGATLDRDREFRAYVQAAATPADQASQADQLAKLADLKQKGDISEDEYQSAKAKILG